MGWRQLLNIYDEIKYICLNSETSGFHIRETFYLFWRLLLCCVYKTQTINFNTSCITGFWNAACDLRAVSPASEMEEIFDRKTDQKSFARQSRDVDIGTADKNDKVSKLFVRPAVPSALWKPTFVVSSHEAARFFWISLETPIVQS